MLYQDEFQAEIVAFLEGYSIEMSPHDAGKIEAIAEALRPGTAVYVAHPPGATVETVVELAGNLQQRGFVAVPHLIARRFESLSQLDATLSTLRESGVRRALVVAGDQACANAAFSSTLELLQTGLLSQYEFRRVGVAGHPEGSKAIGGARAEQALRDKAEFAKTADFEMHIVTQFGFNPAVLSTWESATAAAGVDLLVHVGMAGPASLRQLAKFAMLCGVAASARMLMTRTGATASLLKTQAPDALIAHIVRHRSTCPSSRLSRAHFFAFGGVVKTARWANAVRSGHFELNDQATGFDVDKH